MSSRERWERYAACWSAADGERARRLVECVTEDVVYRDPNTTVESASGLAAYMDGFRQAFPADRFLIDHVDEHHGRSLARWRQVGAGGDSVQHGISSAVHDADGNLIDITGFFIDDPARMDERIP
jgi:hypothetical protein